MAFWSCTILESIVAKIQKFNENPDFEVKISKLLVGNEAKTTAVVTLVMKLDPQI